jgi:hypothetical protein
MAQITIANDGVAVSSANPLPTSAAVAPSALAGTHGQNTTLSSAQTIAIPAGANYVILSAQSQDVRIRLDGTAPTATVGFLINADADPVGIPVAADAVIKAIETAASAKLDYQFLTL